MKTIEIFNLILRNITYSLYIINWYILITIYFFELEVLHSNMGFLKNRSYLFFSRDMRLWRPTHLGLR